MNNKTDIEEDIEKVYDLFQWADDNNINTTKEYKSFENILADRERLQKENNKLTEARNWYFEHTVGQIATPEMLDRILRTQYNIPEPQSKANKYDSLVEKIKEKIEEIRNYEDIAREQIQARIIVADSDSLNFGRKQAHGKDISILQELLDTEK